MFEALKEVDTNCVVVMPDFFVDRILTLRSQEEFCNLLAEKVKFGGGSIRNIDTTERKGGNAVNVAYCLARLGIKNTTLFTIADEFGSAMLHKVFSKFGGRVNLRVEHGRHGRTTGLEFLNSNASKANVMLNDAGDNEYFGSDKIDSDVNLKILENANAVIVVNWGSNLKGSELTRFAFNNSAKSFHYIDPADIESRKDEFREFLRTISKNIHALALNENEANSLGNSLGLNSLLPPNDYDEEDVKNAAVQISSNLGINTDIHTRIGAASSNRKKVDFVPAFEVQAKTLTGAGDSWDSANILCYLARINARERLMFSNAYASLYVRSSQGEHPSKDETLEFLKDFNTI